MGIPIKPRKKYIILLLITLLLAIATYVIYVYGKTKTIFPYSVNKYSDTLNWCEPNAEDGKLNIDCKGLLLSIEPKDDESSCFNVQIITGTKELKDLSICEDTDEIKYTNEVLQYKILMPLDISFIYTQGAFNNFIFKSVALAPIDQTYFQDTINRDIEEITSIDPKSTTIRNSVDFCPRANLLPSYIADKNKEDYSRFINENTLEKEEYNDSSLYKIDDSIIYSLFTCQSKINLGYTVKCDKQNLLTTDISKILTTTKPFVPNFDKELDSNNMTKLKQISYMVDNTNYILFSYLTYQAEEEELAKPVNKEDLLKNFIQNLSTPQNLTEEVYCGMYSLLDEINDSGDVIKTYKSEMRDIIISNIAKSHSPICINILKNNSQIDNQGLYLKYKFSKEDSNFVLFNSCLNLLGYIR